MASRCGAQVLVCMGSVVVERGFSCPAVCGIVPDQGLNCVPCIDRRILNHWATREVPEGVFLILMFVTFDYHEWHSMRLGKGEEKPCQVRRKLLWTGSRGISSKRMELIEHRLSMPLQSFSPCEAGTPNPNSHHMERTPDLGLQLIYSVWGPGKTTMIGGS